MSTIKSSAENLTLNADGANNDIKFQSNGSEVASIDQAGSLVLSGNLTSLGIDDNADATAITIDSSERVGVGTTAPLTNSLLHIQSSASSGVSAINNGLLLVENNTGVGIGLLSNNDRQQTIAFGDPQDNDVGFINYGHDTNQMSFNVNAAERLRITANGITFNGDTAAANALDDYEEGTFTPTVANGTIGAASGEYTKIGNVCTLTFTLKDFNDKSTDAYITIRSLPFTQDGTATVGTVIAYQPGHSNPLNLIRGADGNEFHMYHMINASSWTVQKHNTLGSDPHFYCVATYKTT
jgi:hypothetical protein